MAKWWKLNQGSRYTDEETGIQLYKRGNKYYLKRPNIQNPDEFADKESMLAYYNSLKAKAAPKVAKPTEAQARAKRLGISQAEYDSTMASGKFPQFTTAAQKKEQEKKAKKTRVSVEKLQKERTPDKLASYVKKWEDLSLDVKVKKGHAQELAKRRQQSLLKQIDNAGLKQDFHEQILDRGPEGTRLSGLPDQIMIDPKTKKKYRFVGPDRSDPNSYEEI